MSDGVEVKYHNTYIITRQKLTRRIDERGIFFLEEAPVIGFLPTADGGNSGCNSAVQACKLERGKGTNKNSIGRRLASEGWLSSFSLLKPKRAATGLFIFSFSKSTRNFTQLRQ